MIGKHVVIDTLDNFKTKLDLIPSSAIVLIKDVGQIYAHGTYFGAQKTYSLLTKTADGLAPKGGTSASSLISDVNTEWVLTVTNGENPTWRKLPANAFSSSSYTLPSATVSDLGGIKVGQVYTATFDDLVGLYYKVNIDKNGLAYVHVPWINNPYTASGSGITLKDNVFSLSLNSVTKLDSAIGNKIYAVSLDKNGKLCVSVPWTDTNNIFIGATETKNGSSGMVPAPIANQHNYFLRGDGTWVKPNLSDLNDDVVNGKYLPKASPVYTGILSTKEPGLYQEAETLFFRNASNTTDYGTQIVNNWNDGSSKTTRFILDKTGIRFIDVNGYSKTIYHSGNFNPSDYLPKSGGTLTGVLTLSSGYDKKLILDNTDNDSKYQYISFRQNGTEYGTLGTSFDDNLLWNQNYILHSGNYSSYALPLSGGTISGNLYIGDSNNTDWKLDVNGSINASNIYQNGNYVIHAGNIGSQSVNYSNNSGQLGGYKESEFYSNRNRFGGFSAHGSSSRYFCISSTELYESNNCTLTFMVTRTHSTGNQKGILNCCFRYDGSNHIYDFSLLASSGLSANDIKLTHYISGGKGYFKIYAIADGWNSYEFSLINESAWGQPVRYTTFYSSQSSSLTSLPSSETLYGSPSFSNINNNSESATKLKNSRTIWGQSFDGSRNITGNLTLGNNVYITVTSTGGSTNTALFLDSGNNLRLAQGTAAAGYNTYLSGNNIYFTYGTSRTTGMYLNSSGNVGIGTTNPSYKLDVNGSFNATTIYQNGSSLSSLLNTKLNSSSYTASDVLSKIKTVDGSGSGLDADTVDGYHASSFPIKEKHFVNTSAKTCTYNTWTRVLEIADTNGWGIKVLVSIQTHHAATIMNTSFLCTFTYSGRITINELSGNNYSEISIRVGSDSAWGYKTYIDICPKSEVSNGHSYYVSAINLGCTGNSITHLNTTNVSALTYSAERTSTKGGAISSAKFIGDLVGNADTATALSSSAGSSTNPIYFSGGKPVACTYSLNATVPSNAIFTDTKYTAGKGLILSDSNEFSIYVPRVIQSCNDLPGRNKFTLKEYQYGEGYNLPTLNYYHIYTSQGLDIKYATQLALGMTTELAYYRVYYNGTWKNWHSIINTDTTYSAGTGISISGTTINNSGVRSISAGSANGTISVNTGGTSADVSVTGLGSLAFKSSIDKLTSTTGTSYNGGLWVKVVGAQRDLVGNTSNAGAWSIPSGSPDALYGNGTILRLGWSSGLYYTEIYTGPNLLNKQYGLYWRQVVGGSVKAWKILMDTDNYNYYVPKLDGTGATGTWGISVSGSSGSCTGNAATATNVAWSGVTSKPTTLSGYGITDNIPGIVFCKDARYIPTSDNLNSYTASSKAGLWNSYDNTTYTNGPRQNFGLLVMRINTSYSGQLCLPYNNGSLRYRSLYNTGTGRAWRYWKTILDSDNYTDYALSKTGTAATASKLATARTISLTGSVTGSVSFDGSGNVSIATTTNHTHDYVARSGSGFSQHDKGTYVKILEFTISSGSLNPSISFSWHPTECARDIWADFNINIRANDINFKANWKGGNSRTLTCVGNGTKFSVWVTGTKTSYDPLGAVQVTHTYAINSYSAGTLQVTDTVPSGTYSKACATSGYSASAGNADTVDSYHISVGAAGTNSSTIYFVT